MRIYFKYLFYLSVLICFSAVRAEDSVSFFRAVGVDNASTVSSLLAAGFDPNARDEKGQVALFVALREESPKVVKALLAHPALQVDATNAAGETPLMMAAMRGSIDAAVELLGKGAAINRPGWTPLHYAASSPHTAMVRLLLDKGAAIEALSPNKTTPLMMASRYGSEEVAHLLMSRGASSRARNDQALGAADFARLAGREALARKLEEASR
jgi:ankyrin repeat protein